MRSIEAPTPTMFGSLLELTGKGLVAPDYRLDVGEVLCLIPLFTPPTEDDIEPLPPSARQLLKYLIQQIVWMDETLTEAVARIVSYQSDFLDSLRIEDLRLLPITKVAETFNLPYSPTTYYRLLRRRTLQVRTGFNEGILPVASLTPNAIALRRYAS